MGIRTGFILLVILCFQVVNGTIVNPCSVAADRVDACVQRIMSSVRINSDLSKGMCMRLNDQLSCLEDNLYLCPNLYAGRVNVSERRRRYKKLCDHHNTR